MESPKDQYYFITSTKYLNQNIIYLQDGRLQPGDHILQIGNINSHGMSSQQVCLFLKWSKLYYLSKEKFQIQIFIRCKTVLKTIKGFLENAR